MVLWGDQEIVRSLYLAGQSNLLVSPRGTIGYNSYPGDVIAQGDVHVNFIPGEMKSWNCLLGARPFPK